MWWRLTHADFENQKGIANRRALHDLVASGIAPGLLAFDGDRAIGWCSLGPRMDFVRFTRSRILKPIDDAPVWSVVCFFVDRRYRQMGISRRLLEAAKEWARSQGAEILEGYPVEPAKSPAPAPFVFTGLAAAFAKAGFVECARRSPTRPIMRCPLQPRL